MGRQGLVGGQAGEKGPVAVTTGPRYSRHPPPGRRQDTASTHRRTDMWTKPCALSLNGLELR